MYGEGAGGLGRGDRRGRKIGTRREPVRGGVTRQGCR